MVVANASQASKMWAEHVDSALLEPIANVNAHQIQFWLEIPVQPAKQTQESSILGANAITGTPTFLEPVLCPVKVDLNL